MRRKPKLTMVPKVDDSESDLSEVEDAESDDEPVEGDEFDAALAAEMTEKADLAVEDNMVEDQPVENKTVDSEVASGKADTKAMGGRPKLESKQAPRIKELLAAAVSGLITSHECIHTYDVVS